MVHGSRLDGPSDAPGRRGSLSTAEAAERWQDVKRILADALEVDAERRTALLDDVAARDPDLAREVQSLLGWYAQRPDGASTPAPARPGSRLAEGERLGPYEIEGFLDKGGMGSVYRGRDTRLGRAVAVKVLTGDGLEGSDTLRRFEREARTVASLSHPNILAIYDYGRQGDLNYTVTELLLGENLRRRIQTGPLPLHTAMDLARQIARGLAAAHEKGITHRDLKPENIFLTSDGAVKILDFGLAKLASPADLGSGESLETRAGLIMGTVGYMSPEQIRGEPVDARADIFSLGVVLHELLLGRRPFDRETPAETLAAVLRDELPPYDSRLVPWPLAELLRRCMSKKPEMRFGTAGEVSGLLDAFVPRPEFAAQPLTRRAAIFAVVSAALSTFGSSGPPAEMRPRDVDLTVPVGEEPSALAFGGGYLWVANRLSNNITRIRVADGAVTATFAVGELPVSMTWDGRALWVANHKWLKGDYARLMKLDPESGRVEATYRLPGQPMHLTSDSAHVWVTETWPTHLLRKIRLSDGADLGAFTAGGTPRQAATDGESVWVSNGPVESLTRIRASDGTIIAALNVPGLPNHLRRFGNHIWLANHHPEPGQRLLLKIRGSDLSVAARFAVTEMITHCESEGWFFVAQAGRVLQRRMSDGVVVATWAVGPRPEALVFDGINLWIANQESKSVSMISGQRLLAADSL